MINVGFLGAGNMGSAIMKGIKKSDLTDINLFAFDLNKEKISVLSEYGVTACINEKELFENCQYVFLAVKPQILDTVLKNIAGFVTPKHILVSIVAGITGEYIKSQTISEAKVVLVMPNTPLLVGEGATALSPVEPITDEEFKLVCDIFESCGDISILPNNKMKEIIAINGSSPAFIYLFAKGFVDYAKSQNISEETAKTLFAKTLIGSAKMITDSEYTIDELIKMVSSPGGTTIAGLDKFYEGNLLEVINSACENCTKRAYELSK